MLAFGCTKDQGNDNWLIVQGALVAGENVELSVETIEGSPGEIESAILTSQGISIPLDYDGTLKMLMGPSGFEVLPNRVYNLIIETEQRTVQSTIEVPEQIELTQTSTQTIPIDPNSSGQPIFSVIWTQQQGVSQLLKLNELEVDEIIPFPNGGNRFSITNGSPNTTPGATLSDTDFLRYGTHQLEIFAVPRKYEEVFFYQPSPEVGLLDEGPDNIDQGSGYVVGASKIAVALELIEM